MTNEESNSEQQQPSKSNMNSLQNNKALGAALLVGCSSPGSIQFNYNSSDELVDNFEESSAAGRKVSYVSYTAGEDRHRTP